MADTDLQLSFWLLNLRPFLRRSLPMILVVLDILLAATTILSAVRFFSTEKQNSTIAVELTQNRVQSRMLLDRLSPPVPVVELTALMPSTGKNYNILAEVKNPSSLWAASSVNFVINVGQAAVLRGSTTLLPGEEKFLVALDQALPYTETVSSSVTVTFERGDWLHQTAATRLPSVGLVVDNPQYRVLAAGTQPLSQAVATLKNTTVTGYPEVAVTAVLMSGQLPVAVSSVLLHNITGLEQRPVDLRFYQVYAATSVVMKASVTSLPPTQ